MPQEVDACKFVGLVYSEGGSVWWPYCKLDKPFATRECLTKGRSGCKDYQKGTGLTPEEMRQKIKEERQ